MGLKFAEDHFHIFPMWYTRLILGGKEVKP